MARTGLKERLRRAVFLDRDGTIIEDVDYLTSVAQIRILPGVPKALRRLREAGLLLLVVTNQSAIARGWLAEDDLAAVHDGLNRLLAEQGAPVDAFYYCPHLPDGTVARYRRQCRCRKPEPGLLERAAREWDVDLARSYVIGDSERDVEAGRRAGCTTVLLGGQSSRWADAAAEDIGQAASLIVERMQSRERGAPPQEQDQ